ncbi:MAG: DMT family transporter [Fretibacterium sp.]|nr:DMT family transporter [Fretibacterium sp.]
MDERSRVWVADLLLLTCAFLWGIGFVAMKEGLDAYPTWWLLFLRFCGGAALMVFFFFKRLAQASRQDVKGGAIIGLLLFVAMGLQTLGLNYTTAGKQAFLTASYVIMVPLLIWIGTRKFPGTLTLFASLLCFAGMRLLALDLSGKPNLGDILTVSSALFFALQIIAISHYAADGDPIVLNFLQLVVAGTLSGFMGWVVNGPLVWRGTYGLWEVLYTIFFSTFLCFSIQVYAQKYTPPTHCSLIMSLEAVFGLLFGVLLLHEPFTRRIAIGCLMIFLSVLSVEVGPTFFAFLCRLTPPRSPSEEP